MSAKIPGEAHVTTLHTGPALHTGLGCSTLIEHPDGGKSRLTLLMEAKPGHSDYQGVATEAAEVSMAKAAVAIDECVFLRDALPKTPSGKIQRHRCHALMQAGSFEPLATIRLAGR